MTGCPCTPETLRAMGASTHDPGAEREIAQETQHPRGLFVVPAGAFSFGPFTSPFGPVGLRMASGQQAQEAQCPGHDLDEITDDEVGPIQVVPIPEVADAIRYTGTNAPDVRNFCGKITPPEGFIPLGPVAAGLLNWEHALVWDHGSGEWIPVPPGAWIVRNCCGLEVIPHEEMTGTFQRLAGT